MGRSVLEALRLLEAFRAVARHGVLCPIDWKPTKDASETINTISNTLLESYEDRLDKLQKEFDGIQVTDIDVKHKSEDESSLTNDFKSPDTSPEVDSPATIVRTEPESSTSGPATTNREGPCARPVHPSHLQNHRNDCLPRIQKTPPPSPSPQLSITKRGSISSVRSSSAPQSSTATPTPTPTSIHPPMHSRQAPNSTARHARGTSHLDPHYMNGLFSQSVPSIFQSMIRRISSNSVTSGTDSSSGHSTTPHTLLGMHKASQRLAMQNTYESRRGSHVVLEFADPTGSPPAAESRSRAESYKGPYLSNGWSSGSHSNVNTPGVGGAAGSSGASAQVVPAGEGGQTRLQATFEALKKYGSGLASPRLEHSPMRGGAGKSAGGLGNVEEVRSPGYFDGVVEGA